MDILIYEIHVFHQTNTISISDVYHLFCETLGVFTLLFIRNITAIVQEYQAILEVGVKFWTDNLISIA